MVNKKKYHGGLKLLLPLLFFMVFVTYFNNCKATTYNNLKLTENDVYNIFTSLGKTSSTALDSTNIQYITKYFNEWASFYAYTHPESDVGYLNLVFYYGNQNYSPYRLEWFLANGSFDNDLEFFYISNLTATSGVTPKYFNGWTYNTSTGLISGATTSTISGWEASTSSYATKTVSALFQGSVTTTDSTYSYNRLLTTVPTHAFYGYDSTYGYRPMLNTNYLTLDGMTTLTPTPTPTTTGESGGSGGSTDLTQTNQKIDDVKNEVQTQGQAIINQLSGDKLDIINSITDTPSSGDFLDISSGDILDSFGFQEETDPYENFWISILSGLETALTCSENQSVTLDFLGTEYTLSVSDFNFNYPTPLRSILTTSCIVGIVIAELKMWRKIIIAINTGNIFNLSNNFANNDISDLF